MPEHTPAQKLTAVEREIKKRRRVFPRWVAEGKMSQAFADEQIAVFLEIAADYRREAAALEPDLFGGAA